MFLNICNLHIFEIRFFRGFMFRSLRSNEYERPGSSDFFSAHSVSKVSAPYASLCKLRGIDISHLSNSLFWAVRKDVNPKHFPIFFRKSSSIHVLYLLGLTSRRDDVMWQNKWNLGMTLNSSLCWLTAWLASFMYKWLNNPPKVSRVCFSPGVKNQPAEYIKLTVLFDTHNSETMSGYLCEKGSSTDSSHDPTT